MELKPTQRSQPLWEPYTSKETDNEQTNKLGVKTENNSWVAGRRGGLQTGWLVAGPLGSNL